MKRLALLCLLLMSACVDPSNPQVIPPAESAGSAEIVPQLDRVRAFTVRMPTGHIVDCVLWDTARTGGLQCDFEHRRDR